MHEHDPIGTAHRAHGGDEEHGFVLQLILQIATNRRFGVVIKSTGCFIQHQQIWVLQQGAGNGDPLALATA